jgi:FkbM family methyltransferase
MVKLIVRGVRKLYFHFIKNFRDTIIVNSDYGPFRIFTHDTIIGYSLFKDKYWEMDFPRRVFAFLREKKLIGDHVTLLDLGANIGITSIPFLRSGWINAAIAVEADPDNAVLLRENIAMNNMSDRIFPLHYAVTQQPSELVLEKSVNNFGDHRIKKTETGGEYNEHLRKVTRVPGDSLPNLIKLAPADICKHNMMLWIDIQGHEGYCYKGAKEWLIANKTVAVSEVWPYGILRSGMSLEEFSDIVNSIWGTYYICRDNKFEVFPTTDFLRFLGELKGDKYENVILAP